MKKKIILSFLGLTIVTLMSCKKSDPTPLPPPPQQFVTTTFAGSTQGFAEGVGTTAQFSFPAGIVKDAAGNLFVCDRNNNRIRKIAPDGTTTTFAGSGTAGFVNGNGTAAQFNQPYGLVIDASGNLYVADRMNFAVRKVTPSGVVTTLAGGINGFADGTGTAAQFSELYCITIDASGNVIVPDAFNHRIRKVTQAGVVTTVAGNGTIGMLDGTGASATFNTPFAAGTDAAGNIYVSDYYNHAIRKITPAGVVSILAGNGIPGGADGTGSAASFRQPGSIVADGSGNLYVADIYNNKIRKISAAGVVTTIAGGSGPGNTNGTGTAALFDSPLGMCADFSNNAMYVTEFGNHRIRKITIQ